LNKNKKDKAILKDKEDILKSQKEIEKK